MEANNQNNKSVVSFEIIQRSLYDLRGLNIQLVNINNNKIIDNSKKLESLFNLIFIKKQNRNNFLLMKRNIVYLSKFALKRKDIKLKKNSYLNKNNQNSLLNFIIPTLKIFMENKNHKNIKKIFLILIKLGTEGILPYELFTIIVGLILYTLTDLLKSNNDDFFCINEDPFNIINDIIIALATYPKEIKIEDPNCYILTEVINLFDKYLLSQNFTNIILTETPIWLKLLENKLFIPKIQSETPDNINIILGNKEMEVQKKLYSFLVKIYKFSMRYDYIENIIFKNSIIDLYYYLSSLNFLAQLFLEEIRSIPIYDFKIKDGIFIPKNKYIFFENIKTKSKIKEISIIFSFKIIQLEVNKNIDILEIYDIKKKGILKLYTDEKGFLILGQSESIKLETVTKIKDNFCYFLCITITKNGEVNLFLDGEDKIYLKKMSNFDFSKDFSLALGKNNFFGIIGELLIINKAISNKKINHLFTLKEDYANNLRKIYYDFKMFPKKIKLKYKIGYYNSEELLNSLEAFKQLGFEIIFDIHPNDILYSNFKNIYLNIDNKENLNNHESGNGTNTPGNSEIKVNDINTNNKDDFLLDKKNINLLKNLSQMNYSYDIFYQNNGIDFLSFQLHNIFTKIKDNNLLNIYLYETLSFIMKLFSNYEKDYMYQKLERPRLEPELIVFFISLLTSLTNKKNKNEKFWLDDKLISILLGISQYFQENKLLSERNIILSVLLDTDFYKNKEDIFKHQQIVDLLKKDLIEKKSSNKYIINKEFLYKILILDFCLETKENNHKFFMDLIFGFISLAENLKQKNSDLCDNIHKEFINYIFSLKNEVKIYHYLKIIYTNFSVIKESFLKSPKFSQHIFESKEKIDYNHCKYCAYNQILYYLIEKDLYNESNEKDKNFVFSPLGIEVNPSFLFLKCFFSQLFTLSNKDRIKFIKMKSDPIDFIFELMKTNKEVFDFEKFSPKFENIIGYIKFLIEQVDLKDTILLEKIFFSFRFLLNFLRRITENEINVMKKKENNEEETKQKNEIVIEEKKTNLQILFEKENIINLFEIYLILNHNQAIEDLKHLINISINQIVFPFFFRLIFKQSMFNVNTNLNIDKFNMMNIIIDEFIKHKITLDRNNDGIIIQNNIAFLICIYNLIVNNNEEIDSVLETKILLFLNHLKDINIFNSKYVFDVNVNFDDINKQKNSGKKFILEMVSDIYFHFYENKKYDMIYQCLIKGIFLEVKILDIVKIDIQNYLDEKNKDKEYIFYNNNFLTNIAEGEERQEIIFTIYFLEYLLKKLDSFKNIPKAKINSNDDPNNFIKEIMQLLLNNSIKLFNHYNKKISNSIKILQKKNIYKSYINLLEFIKSKYKTKNLTLDKLIDYYSKKITINKEMKFQRKNKRKYTEINNISNTSSEINKFAKNSENNYNSIFNVLENLYPSKLTLPKINDEKRRNKSLSHFSHKKSLISEGYEFVIIKTDNNSKENEKNNKKIYLKLKKIKSIKFQNKENFQNLFNSTDNPEKAEKPVSNIKRNNTKINHLEELLHEINIPYLYYKQFFSLSDSITMKQLFNPKEYYIWNKFNNILKNIIYSQKKFIYVSNLYKMKFREKNILKSSELKNRSFYLKYPIKVKNFICDNYYRPFTKPDLNFFKNNALLNITHPYLNQEFLGNDSFEIDKICKIEFTRMIPKNNDEPPKNIFVCENINDFGSYFGHLYVNFSFLLFISDPNKDPRKKGKFNEYENIKEEEFYLYSFFLEERITDKNKYIIIFNSEIKEIVIRRFCYAYIGYEIFLKNNKSYLFNFFNKENIKNFLECLIVKLEENKPMDERYINIMSLSLKNAISVPIWKTNINEEIKFDIINDLVTYFEKNDFQNKNFKGELSNFNYLLLLNKYSARSYNDLYQYLIFPLLFLDISRKNERDLSKALALNKDPEKFQEVLSHIQDNFENFGNHFNSIYSTSGYVLYYLVRMNPFTSGQIKLQTNRFDAPGRMFYNFDSYLEAITSSEENRELIPEFFHNYEIFLNLNYLSLGYIAIEKLVINDLDTGDENGIAEFIINMRQKLEKMNILPWVDNVFGCNQDIKNISNNNEIYNAFPSSAYEKNYEITKIALKKQGKTQTEIINEIKDELDVLSFGMIPKQLFKNSLKPKKISIDLSIRSESYTKSNIKKTLESNRLKDIKTFLNSSLTENCKLFELNSNYGQNLIAKSEKMIYILRLENAENKSRMVKRELREKKQLQLLPLSKMICELYQDVFLSCRYIDKIIQINFSDKCKFLIYYNNIITSVEYLSHTGKEISKNTIFHSNNVIFGDEIGFLNLMIIEYKIINKKQMELDKIKITKTIKVHNSLIKGILYNKRLSIIISYSEEGLIAINNAFDFTTINIIELSDEFDIREIKVSEYDLIYIYCINKKDEKLNYIKCYSLNGIKFTEMIIEKNIVNFFVKDNLLVVYENNFIVAFNLYEIEGNPIHQFEPKENKNKININENEISEDSVIHKNKKIIFCTMNNIENKLYIIYDDHQVLIDDVSSMMLKE